MKFVPFDLRQFRCITYGQTIASSKKLKEDLVNTFKEAAKNVFRFKVKENEATPFDKGLVGDGNYLYELKFTCPNIGHDALKMQIDFIRLGFDSPRTKLQNQYLYLGDNKITDKIDNIPWTVSLLRTDGKEA